MSDQIRSDGGQPTWPFNWQFVTALVDRLASFTANSQAVRLLCLIMIE